MLKDRMALVRDLWSAGLKAEILLETLEGQEEIQDFCRVHGISQLVILKDTEGGTVKVHDTFIHYMSHAMQKRVIRHVRAAKAQIRLRVHAV